MSLVQAYIRNDFIVVCGENRAVINNKTNENFRKVFKLNKYTIIGFTGSIAGNACLFGDYVNSNLSLTQLCMNSTYQEIVTHLIDTYHKNFDFINNKGIHSIVCGWDGEKMTGKTFFTKDNNASLNGIKDVTPENQNFLRVVNCGLNKHYENAYKFYKESEPSNIVQVKNVFKNVIDVGVKFDDTINNTLTFEKIRKSDFKMG